MAMFRCVGGKVKPMTLTFTATRNKYSGQSVVITNTNVIDVSQFNELTINSASAYTSSSGNYVTVDGVNAVNNVGKVIDISSKNSISVIVSRSDDPAANSTVSITLS